MFPLDLDIPRLEIPFRSVTLFAVKRSLNQGLFLLCLDLDSFTQSVTGPLSLILAHVSTVKY